MAHRQREVSRIEGFSDAVFGFAVTLLIGPPFASLTEVLVRRLAKANHPDAAGEKNLPRFLAIQAAYESLVESNGTRRPGGRPG